MTTSRREFIKKSALAVAGGSLLSSSLFAAPVKKELMGLQLYCVRDEMKADPLGTLKELAKIGYQNVEHANYVNRKFYGWTPAEFKKVLGDLGMTMPSGHTVLGKQHWDEAKKDFTDAWKYTVEDAAYMGQQFVISPWMDSKVRQSYDELMKQLETFNKSGELCKKSGMKFGYHNHDFEFSEKLNDKTLYDIILQNTDPNLVMQQLDTGNLYNGGAKAIDIVQKYPGRFESLHVKDEILGSGKEKYESTILGTGIVSVKEVVDLCRKSGGTIHFIIEQESYQGKTPLQCMREDYEVMKKWGY
ncbi:MAG TPA: sugar phosphate isomerase/epimerase [Cyclobacteriaceae bacterium]|nr:sugar phosphate isomerase/epimerase [Cyclobacteriaceae bacterium]HPW60953.1 sugar phosphate isomerase/epimerase [Cyclobacteriaceae bacterium]